VRASTSASAGWGMKWGLFMKVISNNLGGHQIMHVQSASEFAIRISD
jgi:hypothetical protein